MRLSPTFFGKNQKNLKKGLFQFLRNGAVGVDYFLCVRGSHIVLHIYPESCFENFLFRKKFQNSDFA